MTVALSLLLPIVSCCSEDYFVSSRQRHPSLRWSFVPVHLGQARYPTLEVSIFLCTFQFTAVMQFTTQQLRGGARYKPTCRIGNWCEEVELNELRMKE